VLAYRQEGGAAARAPGLAEVGGPAVGHVRQLARPRAAPQVRSRRLGQLQQGLVQPPARQAEGGKGQGDAGLAAPSGQPGAGDGHGAETGQVDAEIAEIGRRLVADELAADFVVGAALALQQDDLAARPGQQDGRRGACGSAANHQDLRGHPRTRDTHRRKGNQLSITACRAPAWDSTSFQSLRVKARLMETGPSFCTKGCQRISLASSMKP